MSYISSLSISNYGGSNPSGSFSFYFDGGNAAYNLDREDVERIFAVCAAIIEKKKTAMAEALLNIKGPILIGYDESKTIDNEIPF